MHYTLYDDETPDQLGYMHRLIMAFMVAPQMPEALVLKGNFNEYPEDIKVQNQ